MLRGLFIWASWQLLSWSLQSFCKYISPCFVFASSWQNTPWGKLQLANGSEGQIIDRMRLKSFLGEDVAESRVFGKMHRQESSLTFRRLGEIAKLEKLSLLRAFVCGAICLQRLRPMSGVKISIAVICLFRPTSPDCVLSDEQRRRRSFLPHNWQIFPHFPHR